MPYAQGIWPFLRNKRTTWPRSVSPALDAVPRAARPLSRVATEVPVRGWMSSPLRKASSRTGSCDMWARSRSSIRWPHPESIHTVVLMPDHIPETSNLGPRDFRTELLCQRSDNPAGLADPLQTAFDRSVRFRVGTNAASSRPNLATRSTSASERRSPRAVEPKTDSRTTPCSRRFAMTSSRVMPGLSRNGRAPNFPKLHMNKGRTLKLPSRTPYPRLHPPPPTRYP